MSLFKIERLMRPILDIKEKGSSGVALVSALCLYRITGLSVFSAHNQDTPGIFQGDENSLYRFMNNAKMNWRLLLIYFGQQFIRLSEAHGDKDSPTPKCFVLDDTDLEKRDKTFEFIGRIFNHVIRKHVIGFKLLALAYWDGKSLIPFDFSLHREKGQQGNFGMKKKEQKRQFKKSRARNTPSYKRVKELDMKKNRTAIAMLKRAVHRGIEASYVLMDSWFTCDYVISQIRAIKGGMMHLVAMCKMDTRKYHVDGKELNIHQLIKKYERKKGHYSRKHKTKYIAIIADYKGTRVKLFAMQYRHCNNWTVLLTTDLRLSFVQALELYQIRWTIEVMFKECKQYLNLGKCQNTDFDGQIADCTLVFISYTVLSLQKRFEDYETLGALFREQQRHLLKLTLWERILKAFLKMLNSLFALVGFDVEQTIEKMLSDDKVAKQVMIIINALEKDDENNESGQNCTQSAA